jgi:arylsulfatase A-like enzyme
MQFKNAGYDTLGTGKLWHGGLGWPEQWTTIQDETVKKGKVSDRSIGGIAFGPIVEGGDEAVSDTGIADYGISELSKPHDKPFFLTLGFHKPHMPWNVPQKYYDMHPLADIQLPPTKEGDLSDIPPIGLKMAKPTGDHAAVLASGRWKEAVQAYLATITYLDGQIGRVLDAYEKSPHKNNTIIILWGDHGWHLGEKEHWRKFALWEEATRAPFIWVVPGVTKPGGISKSPVDFMSVYPTLCDLTSVPKPAWLEGDNIKPLLSDPSAAWTGVGITTFGQKNHAIRTDRWRYIRYADGTEELYDHSNDEYEWTNLAANPEHTALKSSLTKHFPTNNVPPSSTGKMSDSEGSPGKDSDSKKIKRKARKAAAQ